MSKLFNGIHVDDVSGCGDSPVFAHVKEQFYKLFFLLMFGNRTSTWNTVTVAARSWL